MVEKKVKTDLMIDSIRVAGNVCQFTSNQFKFMWHIHWFPANSGVISGIFSFLFIHCVDVWVNDPWMYFYQTLFSGSCYLFALSLIHCATLFRLYRFTFIVYIEIYIKCYRNTYTNHLGLVYNVLRYFTRTHHFVIVFVLRARPTEFNIREKRLLFTVHLFRLLSVLSFFFFRFILDFI